MKEETVEDGLLLVASVLRLAGKILTGWGILLVRESVTGFRFHQDLLELGDRDVPQFFPAHFHAISYLRIAWSLFG